AVASDGNLYLADRGNGAIKRWENSTITSLATIASVQALSWDPANNRFITGINGSRNTGSVTLGGGVNSTALLALTGGTEIDVQQIEGAVVFSTFSTTIDRVATATTS